MNCQSVQNKILALPDPRHVPDALRMHVAGCAGCRAWAEQVARLESLLQSLPVPPAPADKKSALVAELTRGTATIELAREPFASPLQFFQRNGTLIAGLAAALVVAFGGWMMFGGNGTPAVARAETPKDPFLDKIVQRDVALAKADTPAKKFQALADMADDLSTQTRAVARVANAEDLQELARLYDRVVDRGIVKQMREMGPQAMTPVELKTQLKSLTDKLGDAATQAEKALGEVPPESKPSLQRIVDAARNGQQKLAVIARDKGV